MLDPQAAAFIDLLKTRQVPPVHTLTAAAARAAYRDRRAYSQPDAPAVAEVRDLHRPGGVALRLYRDPAAGAQPVLVYFHGGGWTIGDLDTHDVLCRQLSLQAGVAVVAVDYGLGPERRFPAAVDDGFEATRWVHEHAASLGLDGSRMALGGDSAGGNLAAVVALQWRDAGLPPPRLQLLIYPATDMRATADSHRSNGQGYVLTSDSIAYYRSHYIESPAEWSDWRASPLLAPDLTRLPPAFVLIAGYDPLRDEGRAYADALSAAGNAAQLVCFERQIHGFITMGRLIDEANTAVALCAHQLRRALHG